MSPQEFVTEVARLIPDAPAPTRYPQEGSLTFTLQWEREGLQVGVASDPEGSWVYFGDAQETVSSPGHAARVMKAIFADQLVVVAAFEGPGMVYCGIALAEDPGAAFNRLDPMGGFNMPAIDRVWIRSWSGQFDHGEPPAGEDATQETGDDDDQAGMLGRVHW